MPKKLGKKIYKQTFEVPGEIAKTAAEQVGIIPQKKEEEPELAKEQLEEKRKKERAESMKGAAQIEAEIREMVKKREKEEIARKKAPKKEEGKEIPVKPLEQSKPKRSRGLLAGLRARLRKTRPELAGRRIGG